MRTLGYPPGWQLDALYRLSQPSNLLFLDDAVTPSSTTEGAAVKFEEGVHMQPVVYPGFNAPVDAQPKLVSSCLPAFESLFYFYFIFQKVF